jgi:hypothetical protein
VLVVVVQVMAPVVLIAVVSLVVVLPAALISYCI